MAVPLPPVNISQTPISGISGYNPLTTGAFFSKDNTTPPSSADLIGDVKTSGITGLSIVGGVIFLTALVLRGRL